MPSLSEILQDPNYVNANEATKQAIFEKYSALDENFTSANPATQDAIRQKFGVAVTKTQPTIDVLGKQFTPEEYQRAAKETGSSLQLPTELLKEGEKAKGAFSCMFGRSLYDYVADMALAWGRASGNTEQAEQEAKRLREYGEKTYTPSTKSFQEDPLEKIQELAGGSAPYMLGPIAAGILAPEGSIGIAAATFPRLAGIAASTPAFTGSNLQRQMEADNIKLADTNLLTAGATAVGQSVLDQVGFSFIPGIKNIFTKAGMEIADEAAEALVKKSILARAGELALKTGEGMGIEGGTEAAQQLLERLQAGLSITDKDARKEYFESFVGGAVLGGALGVPGHLVETLFPEEKKPEDLTEQEQPPGPPAPPGAPPAPPAAPPAAPTAGAISDTEFDDTDITGAPPPGAAPEKAIEANKAKTIVPELQAKVDEYSELLQKYDPVLYTRLIRDINDGFIKSEDDLKQYERSYNEIVQARQKRAELEQEKNELVKSLVGTDEARLLNLQWDQGKIQNANDLKQFKDLVREKSVSTTLKNQMAPKPIEDKEVEKEARELQAELTKYQPIFAEGFKVAIDKGTIQTSEDLDFYRRRLEEYKSRAGESKIKENYGWRSFFDADEIAEREKILENAPQSIKDKVEKADQLIQKITDKVNEAGYSILSSGEEPTNIRNLQKRASGIAGTLSSVFSKSKAIQKNYKRASPEKLDQRLSDLEEETQGSKEDLSQIDVTSMKLNKLIDSEIKTATQESRGQEILDKLSDDNITPKSVANKFWDETYFKLPAETQAYFRTYLNRLTSFKPGSVLATDKEGNKVIAKDWMEVGKDHAIDLGNKAEDLQGTERGYVALMDEANRRMAEKKESEPTKLSQKEAEPKVALAQKAEEKKPEGVSNEVSEQLKKFNARDYKTPEKVRGTKDEELQLSGTPSIKQAEAENARKFKIYEDAAKLFLEGKLDATPGKTPRDRIDTENFTKDSIQPQSIAKKSADKVITNAEEQNKVLSEILDKKDVRYYLAGILIDREKDRMVATDGRRATILKKPDFSSVPPINEKNKYHILKDDNTWIEGNYPDIDRVVPESHSDFKLEFKTKDLADYARGVEKANKFLKTNESFNMNFGEYDAKFIRQMGDLFRRFGYQDVTISLTNGRLLATSPDGRLSHIVMGLRNNNPVFKKFSNLFKVEKAKGARPDGQTIESIKDRIVREFGRSVKKLFDDGLIVVVNSVNELDPKYQNELDNQDKAFFDKETGVAYIIADRVSAGDVRKVVLHEVGEHYGLRGMLGDKVYNEQLENLKKQKNRDITVAKAWDYVLKNYTNLLETDEKQFLREVMAKIGEDAPNHGLWKRFVTAIKSFLVKKGIIKNLTGQELQDLVMRSLHTTIQGRRVLSSGTGLESARGPSDPDAKRELDDEFRANEVPDAPFNNQKDLTDKFKDNFGVVKGAIKGAAGAPKPTAIKMISGLDSKLTDLRIKTVFFGAGLEEKEAKMYAGKLVDEHGKAVASVALTNAVHAGHVAANVINLGKLVFNQTTQMFQAVQDQFSMANVFKAERALFKKLGKQTATNLINTFFEAKRARSIQNEFLNREAELQRAIDEKEDPEVAQRNYEAILKAYKKIPDYFLQKDEEGNVLYTDVIGDNGEVVDQIPVINDEVIDNYIDKDNEFPELRDMMDNWTKVNHNMIDNMVFAGIISKKRGDHLKSIKDYVPWFRIQDDAEELHAPSTFVAGLTNISKEKTFKRGATKLRIDNVVDNMVHNVMMMTRNSIRNYGALQIAKSFATRKPNGKLAVFPKEGIMPDGAVRINILVNGRRVIIEIKDPQIAASLLGLENLEIPMLNGFSQLSQTLRRGVTSNPMFQFYQVFKDAPTAAAVTGLKSPYKIWAKILGSFFSALNPNDEIVKTLKSYGIGGFHTSARTAEKEVEMTKGQRLMNIGPWILKILDHIGDASDYAQRRIIYQETIKQGGTEMEAIFRANAVIDFMRHGNSKVALGLVRTVSFMNAYAQQIDVLATSMAGGGFKGMDRKKARRRFAKTTAALMVSTLIYCMLKGGDDDYEDLDDQTKMRNYIIGDMKIPMGTSYSFFFKSMVEMAYSKIMNEGTAYAVDNTRLRRALSRAAADSLLGPNPIATGAKPFIEVVLNRNFFTGGTVVPRGLENMESFRQYTATTSNLGKVISALTFGALNPIQADHIVRGIFGTAGALGMWGSDLFTEDKPERTWAQNPIVGQMFLPPEPRGREDQFYDLKQRSDEAYNTWMSMVKNQRTLEAKEYMQENKDIIKIHDYITSAEAGLKEKNAQIRIIADTPKIDPAEKRRRITRLQEQKNDIIKNINYFRQKAGQ